MVEEGKDKVDVNKEELETFLRNVPNPVVLGVFGENCSPCEELQQDLAEKEIPEKVVVVKLSLANEQKDIEIADLLAVEVVPTVIAFCKGEEVGRTSNPEELDALFKNLQNCEVSE